MSPALAAFRRSRVSGEKALADYLVVRSSGLETRETALLSVASHQLRRDNLDIRGIQLDPDMLSTA